MGGWLLEVCFCHDYAVCTTYAVNNTALNFDLQGVGVMWCKYVSPMN